MSDIPPSEQGKIPGTSSNGPFVVVAVILALALVGMLVMKFRGSDDKPTTTTAEPPKPSAQAKPVLTDSIPPPPEEDKPEDKPDAGPAPSAKKAIGTGTACGGSCAGTLSSASMADLRGRSAIARGCYERALRTNSMLQGKMVVNVSVDPNGNICSASASGDTLGAPDVTSCVLGAFRGQHVAAPTGGCANSTMTLNFQPKNK